MGRGAKIGLGVVAALSVAGAVAAWWLVGQADQRVRDLAAPHMGCSAADIRVVEGFQGDTTETYELAGCGKSGTLLCSAPDFDCIYAPTN